MSKVYVGQMNASGKKFGLVVSRFNEFISSKLLEGAQDTLIRHGASEKDIDISWVPGSFEIPYVAKLMADLNKYDSIICLGAVIRGDTPHFEYIASEVTKGIARISLDKGIPVLFGIITADTLEQAIERAGTKAGNKGKDAAESAIELVSLSDKLSI